MSFGQDGSAALIPLAEHDSSSGASPAERARPPDTCPRATSKSVKRLSQTLFPSAFRRTGTHEQRRHLFGGALALFRGRARAKKKFQVSSGLGCFVQLADRVTAGSP